MNNVDCSSRLIKAGPICLGVATSSSLTLTTGDQNNSLFWSRQVGSASGKHHSWSPWGNGKPNAALPGFNGERVDPVSGAYHLGNGYRAYNPVLRRFNCPDSMSPFGAGGINPYAYCAGDPVNHTDPSGHMRLRTIASITIASLAILGTVVTAGSSIVAAGGIMAAMSSMSAYSVISGALSITSAVTAGVAAGLEDTSPKTASYLNWISLGTGVASIGTSVMGVAATNETQRNLRRQEYIRQRVRQNIRREFGGSRPAAGGRATGSAAGNRSTGAARGAQQNQRPRARPQRTTPRVDNGTRTVRNQNSNILRPLTSASDSFDLLRSSRPEVIRNTINANEGNLSAWIPENISRSERVRFLRNIHPDRFPHATQQERDLYTRATQNFNNRFLPNLDADTYV